MVPKDVLVGSEKFINLLASFTLELQRRVQTGIVLYREVNHAVKVKKLRLWGKINCGKINNQIGWCHCMIIYN